MSKNERQGPRKPATKFPHLRKKMEKQKSQQPKKPKKKCILWHSANEKSLCHLRPSQGSHFRQGFPISPLPEVSHGSPVSEISSAAHHSLHRV